MPLTFAAQLGQQAAGQAANSAIGSIFGLAMEKHNDNRQYDQQKRLQDLQIAGDMRLTDYNYQKQMEMWENTSYPKQMEMLQKAGLNPGLIYGMGGGGGQTTGSGGATSVSGASAPSGGGEIYGMVQNQMQMQLLNAQKDVLESQAEKNRVEAAKTAGVDTELAKTQTQSLTQGIENQKVVAELNKVQIEMNRVDLGFSKGTYEERMEYIKQQEREMTGRATQALVQGNIDSKTEQAKIDTIKAEYIARLLENALVTAKTKSEYQGITESQSRVHLNEAQMNKIAQELMLSWDRLGNEKEQLQLLRTKVGFDTDVSNTIIQGLTRSIGDVIIGRTMGGGMRTYGGH